MKVIERVEIKHFRSFLGTPSEYKVEINDLKDLNTFSGANDSGKSNILRALNLFFNDRIDYRTNFDFDRDFFIGKSDAGHKVIEIKIDFNLSWDKKRDKFLPERFQISKFYDRNGFRNYVYSFDLKGKGDIRIDSRAEQNKNVKELFLTSENPSEEQIERAEKREWNYRVKFSGFLNQSVVFEYVPAIRDKNFFAQLFGRVISEVKRQEDITLNKLAKEKNQIVNWKKTRENKGGNRDFKVNIEKGPWRVKRLKELEKLMKEENRLANALSKLESEINKYSIQLIKSIDFLDSEFKIGKDLQDFFEAFDIGTGSEKSISFKLRGDGIQAKFIPKFLNFLAEINEKNKYYLWGFEEPENSAEYKNQQELAKTFKNIFSKDKQIFLTSHSEEFLQLYDESNIEKADRIANLYHIKKFTDSKYGDYSQIFLFDVDESQFEFANQKAELDEDLGQSLLRAKYAKELKTLGDEFLKDKEELEKKNHALKTTLAENRKPIVFVEDKYDQIYKISWLKAMAISFNKTNFEAKFETRAPFVVHKAEGASNLAGFMRAPNIDFWKDRKIIGLFDFDEAGREQFKNIKNDAYWSAPAVGDKKEGISKKRSGHDCFIAMLITVPERLCNLTSIDHPSYVEIENLLPEQYLRTNSFVSEKTTTGDTSYLKMKDNKKSSLWKKLFDLDRAQFDDFKPLFKKIHELFGLEIPTQLNE